MPHRDFLFTAIESAYDTFSEYVRRFEDIRLNYQIDVQTDPKTIKAEKRVDVLRNYCQRYKEEMRALEGILPNVRLGMLALKQGTIHEEVIPVCRDLLVILDSHIPKFVFRRRYFYSNNPHKIYFYYRIAIALVDTLTVRASDLMSSLDAKPNTTVELVQFMRYFEECGKQIESLIEEVDVAYKCFVLMQDYNVFVDEPEKESYMGNLGIFRFFH